MKPLFEIVNTVSLWKVDRTFEINGKICESGKKFNAEVLTYKSGKYLIFASGSITAVGFLSTARAREGLEYFFPNNTIDCLRVANMVASGQIFIRNFNELCKFKDIIWEPEIFPAAYWYFQKKCISIYPSGKIIISGAQHQRELSDVYHRFKRYIRQQQRNADIIKRHVSQLAQSLSNKN